MTKNLTDVNSKDATVTVIILTGRCNRQQNPNANVCQLGYYQSKRVVSFEELEMQGTYYSRQITPSVLFQWEERKNIQKNEIYLHYKENKFTMSISVYIFMAILQLHKPPTPTQRFFRFTNS